MHPCDDTTLWHAHPACDPRAVRPCHLFQSTRFFLWLLLAAVLIALPICAFAQEEKAAEKAARAKAKQEAKAREQASPEGKKPEEEKPGEPAKPADPMSSPTFNGLRLRSIGPAFTSGRISSIAVDPN